jgi:hypothetical protein
MLKTALAKALTVKVAAATIGVAALGGGIALAGTSGTLTTAGHGGAAKASHAPANPTGKATAGRSDDGHGSDAAPSPSLVGLCRAYAAGVADNPGKALENPAFGALIAAAGSKANVEAFCAPALKKRSTNAPTAKPTKPTQKPDNGSGMRPSQKATPPHLDKGKPTPSPAPVPDAH